MTEINLDKRKMLKRYMSMNVFGVCQNWIYSLKISLCYIEYSDTNIYHSQNFSAFVFVHSIKILYFRILVYIYKYFIC